jgi:preprotein translocase subunit SecG
MLYVLIPIYVLICLFLILVVLLQQGKGADIAGAFGASSSQTTFGPRGAANVFERITTWAFVAFSVLAITISLLQTRSAKTSVMKGVDSKKSVPAKSAPAPVAPKAPAEVPAAPGPAK